MSFTPEEQRKLGESIKRWDLSNDAHERKQFVNTLTHLSQGNTSKYNKDYGHNLPSPKITHLATQLLEELKNTNFIENA
jgi:hypothetical protein